MADILRIHYVELIGLMRDQAYVCDALHKNQILTNDNRESVMCEKTNSARNRVLVDYVRSRFNRGFKHFCNALESTDQHELLMLLDPNRIIDGGPKASECSVCLSLPPRVVFIPCGHLTSCKPCADKLDICPLCREKIREKINVFE
jgi:hypothetical protein